MAHGVGRNIDCVPLVARTMTLPRRAGLVRWWEMSHVLRDTWMSHPLGVTVYDKAGTGNFPEYLLLVI